jgi:hypothetical protein
MTEECGKRELRSKDANDSGVTEVVTWAPNQVFEKSESGGEISKGKSPFAFAFDILAVPLPKRSSPNGS